MSTPHESTAAFRHEAFFYSGWAEFVIGTLPFIKEGLQADEPVLVVVSAEKRALLHSVLEGDADRVLFADMAQVGANPALIIPAWRSFVKENGKGTAGLRGIGEPIWNGRSNDELVECQRHESLLNVAFAGGQPWRLLCPYDKGRLDAAVIEEARRSHEFVHEDGRSTPSELFRGVAASSGAFSEPLPEPEDGEVDELAFGKSDLPSVREVVRRRSLAARMARSRAADLVAAVNEVATNAVIHGGGTGRLRIWLDRTKLICEIRDEGFFDRPLADRQEPGPEASAPRGLWLANQLCDLVQIRALPRGTAVRLHMRTDSIPRLNVMPDPHPDAEPTDHLN